MNLILARHGNTFAPGEPVIWAGATNDIPLAEKGIEQAHRLADSLSNRNIIPSAIYCSQLTRTLSYASIISKKLGITKPPIADSRLHEIDYGDWTGLTNEQVKDRFGAKALSDWEKMSIWPENANWSGSRAATITEVESFTSDLLRTYQENETLLVISSNGRLRYFLTLIEGEFEARLRKGTFKMKTGNIGKIKHSQGIFSISCWDQDPQTSL